MSQTAVFAPSSPPADPALRQPLQTAGLLSRLGAYLVDITLVVIVSWFLSFAVLMTGALVAVGANGGESFTFATEGAEGLSVLLLVSYYLLCFVPPMLYFVLLPASRGGFNGRTLGKRMVGIRVVNVDGTLLTPAASRRRVLAFFGPAFGALVVGTVLDGLAGTPLIFMGILTVAAAVYTTIDFTFAPASSEYRTTLHDRFAKTVVVRSGRAYTDPTDVPAPITPRPRTGRLNLLNVIGGLYLLLVVAVIVGVIVIAASDDSSSDASSDGSALIDSGSEASSGDSGSNGSSSEQGASGSRATAPASGSEVFASEDSPAEPDDELSLVQGGRVDVRADAPTWEEAANAAKSASGAQVAVTAHARKIAGCLGEFNDYLSCAYGSMNHGFDAEVLIDGQPGDGELLTGRSVVAHEDDGDSRVLSVLVYDRNGIGWGYAFNEAETSITPMCTPVKGTDCTKSKANDGFTEDDAAFKSVERAYDAAR